MFRIDNNILSIIIIIMAPMIALAQKFEEELHVFQQVGYYQSQLLIQRSKARFFADHIIFYLPLVIIAFMGSGIIGCKNALIPALIFIVHIIMQGWIIRANSHKTPLNKTPRVQRLLTTSTVLPLALTVIIGYVYVILLGQNFGHMVYVFASITAICFLFSDAVVILANYINKPFEEAINQKYIDEAKEFLRQAPFLKIIAITGSYGKTSTKNILGDMLKAQFNTLISPASYNTKLGLTRNIRASLIPITEIFVAEMGSKKFGEIGQIAEFVRPDMSVITSVGPQHMATFGSVENIKKEKGEVFNKLKKGGTAFVNLDDEYIHSIPVPAGIKTVTYSVKKKADYYLEDIYLDSTGYSFTLVARGKKQPMHSQLLGRHNLTNILAAAAIAAEMGVSLESIQFTTKNLRPVKNRLSTRTESGVLILEDAFNSNPVGAVAALDVLKQIEGGTKIIMTPGMIELGDLEEETHLEFGRAIAKTADIAILVGKKQTKNIRRGIEKEGFDPSKLHIVPNMKSAFRLKDEIAKPGDVVLIENDLPDLFEE